MKKPSYNYENDFKDLSTEDIIDIFSGFDDIDLVDEYGDTPLLYAAKGLNLDLVKYLLEEGANPDYVNSCGEAPLHCVIDNASKDEVTAITILEDLLNHNADIELVGYMGKTPFLKSCSRDSLQVIKFLVARGCNTSAFVKEYGNENFGDFYADTFHLLPSIREYVKSVVEKR